MKLVADECVDYGIIRLLRENACEVFAIMDEIASIKDINVLEIANSKNCLLLTEDKDFGELVFRLQLPNHGVILVRTENSTRQEKIIKVTHFILENYQQLTNCFSVVYDDKVKIRKL